MHVQAHTFPDPELATMLHSLCRVGRPACGSAIIQPDKRTDLPKKIYDCHDSFIFN